MRAPCGRFNDSQALLPALLLFACALLVYMRPQLAALTGRLFDSVLVGQAPCILGVFLTLQPEIIIRRLWLEMRDAKQKAKSASAEAAAERSHSWALEAARREQLLTSAVRRPTASQKTFTGRAMLPGAVVPGPPRPAAASLPVPEGPGYTLTSMRQLSSLQGTGTQQLSCSQQLQLTGTPAAARAQPPAPPPAPLPTPLPAPQPRQADGDGYVSPASDDGAASD